MKLIRIEIASDPKIIYDYLLLTKTTLKSVDPEDPVFAAGDFTPLAFVVDGIFTHYFTRELRISKTYRKCFLKRIYNQHPCITELRLSLVPAKKEIIDYAWNERTVHMAWERLELDHALSWLSTLGGAFSALGDYFPNCAEMAGKISLNQFKLALRLHDPTILSRCRLFLSLSLIQRGYYKLARNIIENEYRVAKNAVIVDSRLIKMCLGIWSKLKYEYQVKRKLQKLYL